MKRFLGWSDSKDDPFRKGTITEKTPDEDEDRENDKDDDGENIDDIDDLPISPIRRIFPRR